MPDSHKTPQPHHHQQQEPNPGEMNEHDNLKLKGVHDDEDDEELSLPFALSTHNEIESEIGRISNAIATTTACTKKMKMMRIQTPPPALHSADVVGNEIAVTQIQFTPDSNHHGHQHRHHYSNHQTLSPRRDEIGPGPATPSKSWTGTTASSTSATTETITGRSSTHSDGTGSGTHISMLSYSGAGCEIEGIMKPHEVYCENQEGNMSLPLRLHLNASHLNATNRDHKLSVKNEQSRLTFALEDSAKSSHEQRKDKCNGGGSAITNENIEDSSPRQFILSSPKPRPLASHDTFRNHCNNRATKETKGIMDGSSAVLQEQNLFLQSQSKTSFFGSIASNHSSQTMNPSDNLPSLSSSNDIKDRTAHFMSDSLQSQCRNGNHYYTENSNASFEANTMNNDNHLSSMTSASEKVVHPPCSSSLASNLDFNLNLSSKHEIGNSSFIQSSTSLPMLPLHQYGKFSPKNSNIISNQITTCSVHDSINTSMKADSIHFRNIMGDSVSASAVRESLDFSQLMHQADDTQQNHSSVLQRKAMSPYHHHYPSHNFLSQHGIIREDVIEEDGNTCTSGDSNSQTIIVGGSSVNADGINSNIVGNKQPNHHRTDRHQRSPIAMHIRNKSNGNGSNGTKTKPVQAKRIEFSANSFEVYTQLPNVPMSDVMDVLSNPNLLSIWLEPVTAVYITDHRGGLSASTRNEYKAPLHRSGYDNGFGEEEHRASRHFSFDSEESASGAGKMIIAPAVEEVERKPKNKSSNAERAQHDGEWIQATTPPLIPPTTHTSCLTNCVRNSRTYLGFPSSGTITMFIERYRGQVGLTIGSFSGGTVVSHTITVTKVQDESGRDCTAVIDRVSLFNNEHDEHETWNSIFCIGCDFVWNLAKRCFVPSLTGYMHQTVSSFEKLRNLVENGGEIALYSMQMNKDDVGLSFSEENNGRVPLLG